jgi:hypothetical protein
MKLLYSAFFIALLVLGAIAYADERSKSAPQGKQESDDAAKTSITGCLTKGPSEGKYVITDQTSGEKLPFNAPSQIDRFINQTVRLTGTMSGEGNGKVFNPETLSQVSPACAKAQVGHLIPPQEPSPRKR